MYTTAKKLPKSNIYGILSSLLPKTIENRPNFVWHGGPFIWTHPVGFWRWEKKKKSRYVCCCVVCSRLLLLTPSRRVLTGVNLKGSNLSCSTVHSTLIEVDRVMGKFIKGNRHWFFGCRIEDLFLNCLMYLNSVCIFATAVKAIH